MFNITRKPIHPGKMLKHEFLENYEVTEEQLAKDIDVDLKIIKDIINEKVSITDEIAEKLGRYFNTTQQMWLNMQKGYDELVEKKKKGKKKAS